MASLVVESLFQNVAVEAAVKIISDCVYKSLNLPPLNIPEIFSKNKAVFRCPEGKLCNLIIGIAMASLLGPTFANFYMSSIENKILGNLEMKHITWTISS